MVAGSTVNSGSSRPGTVSPSNATPIEKVTSLHLRAIRSTSSSLSPRWAADAAARKTKKSPAMPRRSETVGEDATSSVTSTIRASMPCCALAWSAASPKCMTSPA